MALIDLPPGLNTLGLHAAQHESPPFTRKLSRIAVWLCFFCLLGLIVTTSRKYYRPGAEVFLVGVIACWLVSLVCWAVRKATLIIGSDGISWGWGQLRVKMKRARIQEVCYYDDAIALVPGKGSTWYLSQQDWLTFNDVEADLQQHWPNPSKGIKAPLRAKLQAYGITVNLLAVGSASVAILLFVTSFWF